MFLMICCILLTSCRRPDPELNSNTKIPATEQLIEYERQVLQFDFFDTSQAPLSMQLRWFMFAYEDVYTGETKTFWINSIDEKVIQRVDNKYNENVNWYSFLKPYRDCLLLLDKYYEVTDEDLEDYKATILYAIEYYAGEEENSEDNAEE
ncbi:hypothetical protein KTH81_01180 [Lachnospiraceae bacterium ASD3451]|uniref:hypothetical protein n=2 Tax=Diplocloster agilis TaxID=2850323 RepID=UPI001DC54BB1|nr:hypothetical protein [Diplocloster agilis]MBU9742419.1 hypothetical protein [Diplocloster agilis]